MKEMEKLTWQKVHLSFLQGNFKAAVIKKSQSFLDESYHYAGK